MVTIAIREFKRGRHFTQTHSLSPLDFMGNSGWSISDTLQRNRTLGGETAVDEQWLFYVRPLPLIKINGFPFLVVKAPVG